MNLIAHQKTLISHTSGNVGGLSPWRRAQIQNPFSWLRIQKHRNCHSAGLLNIINSCFMESMLSRSGFLVIVIPLRTPAHRRKTKPLSIAKGQTGWFPLQGIPPQPLYPLCLITFKKCRKLLSQKLLHPFQKSLRQFCFSFLLLFFISIGRLVPRNLLLFFLC